MRQRKSSACYLCGTPIDENNDSKEHIIPNSIGGRKKRKDLSAQHVTLPLGMNGKKSLPSS